MNENVFLVYKEEGETPLAALEHLRQEKHLGSVPMTYAGRLDPLAEGLLLILVGEECKKKDEYLVLPKKYSAEILLGIETDTYDILGIPKLGQSKKLSQNVIETSLPQNGTFSQVYPPYASKTINGRALHSYAREGMEVQFPKHDVTLISSSLISVETVTARMIEERVKTVTEKVIGDFRQEEIKDAWHELLAEQKEFQIIKVSLEVSSGFYVRTFAHDLGKLLGTTGCVYSLKRTKIGQYELKQNK